MTVTEMKYEFDNQMLPIQDFQDFEISEALTMAQHNVVINKISGANKEGTTVNEDEKRRVQFSELMKNTKISLFTSNSTSVNFPNAVLAELPTDFLYALTERCDIEPTEDNDCYDTITGVQVKAITENYYNSNINNSLRNPYVGLIWRVNYMRAIATKPIWDDGATVSLKRHELVPPSGFTLLNYYLRYIRRPNPIIINVDKSGTSKTLDGYAIVDATSKDCELDPFIHREIVSEAVRLFHGYRKDQFSYQVSSQEKVITE